MQVNIAVLLEWRLLGGGLMRMHTPIRRNQHRLAMGLLAGFWQRLRRDNT